MSPQVSIIMPTHNRADILNQTLGALANQTIPPSEYELILVADGCTDGTARLAREFPAPYAVTVIEQPGSGAAAARNRGVEEAGGRVLLFLDDDKEACRELIEAHLNAHARSDSRCVALGYYPMPASITRGDPHANASREWWDLNFEELARPGHRFTFKDFCTGNASVSAELFGKAGGFDEAIPGAGGEDYELGIRLLQAGARFCFVREALSLHHDFMGFERSLGRARAEGFAFVVIVRKHPELFWTFLDQISRLEKYPFLWRLLWKMPALADAAAWVLSRSVFLARDLSLWGIMWGATRAVRGHAYWRGVHRALGSLEAWEELLEDAPLFPDCLRTAEIDIARDLDRLDEILCQENADSVRLSNRSAPLGLIWPQTGAQSLSGAAVWREIEARFPHTLIAREIEAQFRVPAPPAQRARTRMPGADLFTGNYRAALRACRGKYLGVRTKVAEFDIAQPSHVFGLEGFDALFLLIRNHGWPVAILRAHIPNRDVIAKEEIAALVEIEALAGRVSPAPDPFGGPFPPISVIVCSGRRTHSLAACLDALLRLRYPYYEVIVAAHGPAAHEIADLVGQTPFRFLGTGSATIETARNRATAEARHEIVAFIDDKAVADYLWLEAIAAALAEAAAVTGLMLPSELAFPAQHIEEQFGHGPRSLEARIYDPERMNAMDRLATGEAGTLANMAFHRQTFQNLGACSDVEIFPRMLAAGLKIRYQPSALVWKRSRRRKSAGQ